MKKPSPKPTYHYAMETLLQAIDAAPIVSDHPIFKKQDDKEFYETKLDVLVPEAAGRSAPHRQRRHHAEDGESGRD